MQNHSENTKRIAKNTLMLYGRMLFSIKVSLFISRVDSREYCVRNVKVVI